MKNLNTYHPPHAGIARLALSLALCLVMLMPFSAFAYETSEGETAVQNGVVFSGKMVFNDTWSAPSVQITGVSDSDYELAEMDSSYPTIGGIPSTDTKSQYLRDSGVTAIKFKTPEAAKKAIIIYDYGKVGTLHGKSVSAKVTVSGIEYSSQRFYDKDYEDAVIKELDDSGVDYTLAYARQPVIQMPWDITLGYHVHLIHKNDFKYSFYETDTGDALPDARVTFASLSGSIWGGFIGNTTIVNGQPKVVVSNPGLIPKEEISAIDEELYNKGVSEGILSPDNGGNIWIEGVKITSSHKSISVSENTHIETTAQDCLYLKATDIKKTDSGNLIRYESPYTLSREDDPGYFYTTLRSGFFFDDEYKYEDTVGSDTFERKAITVEYDDSRNISFSESSTSNTSWNPMYFVFDIPAKVIAHYVDEDGNAISEDEIIEGYIDDDYTTTKKDIAKYTFKEVTGETSGKMTEDDIEVTYVYTKNKGTLTVKHVDDDGNDLVDPETSTELVDTKYETSPKDIKDYVVKETPSNAKGEYTEDLITVTYVYEKAPAKLTVSYVDEDGNKLTDDVVTAAKMGDPYGSEEKVFDDYDFVEATGDPTSGNLEKEETVVVYTYTLKEGTLTVKYVTADGKDLKDEEVTKEKVRTPYETKAETFTGYDLISTPENASGTYAASPTTVTYIYALKDALLNVLYVDKDGKPLSDDVTEATKWFSKYSTKAIEFDRYKLIEVPENASGEINSDEVTVTYVYEKLEEAAAAAEDTEKPDAEPEKTVNSAKTAVATGDDISVLVGASAILICAALSTFAVYRRKKKSAK